MNNNYDIFIIGGGINGCGIARDAAGRGYSVYLCEAEDLASGTSSQSTKLIHGGLRYLEYYEFRLVREALTEREILWKLAPHIIHPLRFILPHHKDLRPAWLLRLGLFLYDHIGGRKKLPATTTLNLETDEAGKPLKHAYKKGFEYSDCAVDDARLVLLNALDAAEHGASINTRTQCIEMQRDSDQWTITVEDKLSKETKKITAKLLINASGPWVDRLLDKLNPDKTHSNIRLVQGSHIIVPRLYEHKKSYIFQNKDKRIIFTIPYHDEFTLIGTTDHEYTGDPRETKITQEEINYLCEAVNTYFTKNISPKDIVGTFAGVRSLYNDGASTAQEATRDYVLRIDQATPDTPPLINLFGGKITTYRCLAESVLEKVENLLKGQTKSNKEKWTENAFLPGGDFKTQDFEKLCNQYQHHYPFLSSKEIQNYIKRYGTRTRNMLGNAKSYHDLKQAFGHGLYQQEVEFLIKNEWAMTAEDILWRRTKLGLVFTPKEVGELESWVKAYISSQ